MRSECEVSKSYLSPLPVERTWSQTCLTKKNEELLTANVLSANVAPTLCLDLAQVYTTTVTTRHPNIKDFTQFSILLIELLGYYYYWMKFVVNNKIVFMPNDVKLILIWSSTDCVKVHFFLLFFLDRRPNKEKQKCPIQSNSRVANSEPHVALGQWKCASPTESK